MLAAYPTDRGFRCPTRDRNRETSRGMSRGGRILQGMQKTINANESRFQRRVYRVVEIEKLGISQSTTYRRARADGPWTRLAPGVVLVAPGPPTVHDRIQAALLRAGPGAVITGLVAAHLHGITTSSDDVEVHVLIPHGRKIQSYTGTRFERTIRLPEPTYVNGVPTAPPVRAVMDGARTFRTWAFTQRLLHDAIHKEARCKLNDLITELDLGSRRGTAVPRAILRSFQGGTTPLRGLAAGSARPANTAQRTAA
ncbi:Transcriptional regulator, AbiEi antitoxin, Type IV TA system [Saccharopolyspora antimicrobica]|uniref:Transcriptional regulator, AbiEi antitoxin, Type IV TA system n=2 Tax=Saccharopolyspora antimicrobica TaxID=455193 RepID=A0A1I5KKQ2_9PSEU|nr:Transcriptional regulator, AbiEi antitoxin, Type IV TA system [Saccharopolyspora antimicrobica]SFO85467.1 Transcriptional regulator, AbiEi antitoxin, Type IV TA system [Saccharopolyspora antimicrobica]